MSTTNTNPIVLYDGVCGLCNRLVQFLLKRDRHDRFRFASLQSELSHRVLTRHQLNPHDLDTVYVIQNYDRPDENLLGRSDAILYMLSVLGGIWSLSAVGRVLPHGLRDALYKVVASNRYSVFGKHESCMLPEPKHRAKFLDV